jgi:hypothetical protein
MSGALPTELLGPTGSVRSTDLLGAKAQPAPHGIATDNLSLTVTHECPGRDQITYGGN